MTPLDYLRAISDEAHRVKIDGAYVVWQTPKRADISCVWWPGHGVIAWSVGVVRHSASEAIVGVRSYTALADGDLWRRPGRTPVSFADLIASLPPSIHP